MKQYSFRGIQWIVFFVLLGINLPAQVLSDEYVLAKIDMPLYRGWCGFDNIWMDESGQMQFKTPNGENKNGLNELIAYGHHLIPQLFRLEQHLKYPPEKMIYLFGEIARPEDKEVIDFLNKFIDTTIVRFEKINTDSEAFRLQSAALSALNNIEKRNNI